MVKWGFGNDNLCQCGEPQIAYHIVNDCKSIEPPCNLTDVDNPKAQTISDELQLVMRLSYERVICFYCGGGLKNWESNDNPWYENAKWFPLCEYVLKKQGMDYVKDITLKYPKLNRPKLKNPRKANDVKIIHKILNDSRSTETKQKAVEWEVLMLLDPNVAYAKRWVLMHTKSDEH